MELSPTYDTVDAPIIARNIKARRQDCGTAVSAFWIAVKGDRSKFIEDLRAETEGLAIVLPVRDIRFDNPNAIGNDFVALLERERDHCVQVFDGAAFKDGFAVVLVSRTELQVPQLSSPFTVPEWIPSLGGSLTEVTLEDLTWTHTASISTPETRLREIASLLFRLDQVAIARILDVAMADGSFKTKHVGGLLESISTADDVITDLIHQLQKGNRAVSSPESFRPNIRRADTLVGRLIRLMQSSSPDEFLGIAKSLTKALDLPENVLPARESFASVLFRPNSQKPSPSEQSGLDLMISMSLAFRLLTAGAHADEYGQYPLPLLRAFSLDIRSGLDSAIELISHLPSVRQS